MWWNESTTKKKVKLGDKQVKKYSILEGILLYGQPNEVIAQYNETAQKMWGENFLVIKNILL